MSGSISINREEKCNLRSSALADSVVGDVCRCHNQINPVESGQVAKRSIRKLRRRTMEMHCLNTISPTTMNDLFYMSFAAQSIAHRRLRIMSFCSNKRHLFHSRAVFVPFLCRRKTSELLLKSDKRTTRGNSIPRLITVEREIRQRKTQIVRRQCRSGKLLIMQWHRFDCCSWNYDVVKITF